MYPIINIGNWITIYTFGLCMVIAWGVFFSLLHYFCIRRGIPNHIFASIIDFTLSIFFFSRIFYILSDWRTEKFIFIDLFEKADILLFLKQFFITDNYSLSFAGGIIGFFVIFIWKTIKNSKDRPKYLDSIIPAFLIAGSIGYIGTLLGGQIYGIVMDNIFSITYTGTDSIVPFQNPTFPLPIVYSMLCLSIVYFLYRIETKIHVPVGFVGYIGLGIFSIFIFLGEFLNGSSDLFSSLLYLNITQIIALILVSYGLIGLIGIIKS